MLFPHYTFESIIYTGIWIITMSFASFCVVIWCLIELGISASEQRKYYEQKFPKEFIGKRVYNVVPFVY